MNSDALKLILAGVARHVLTTAGGALVTDGVIQSSDLNGFIGTGMVVAGIGWSWWQKVGQAEVAAMLKKVTAKATTQAAVAAAQVAPAAAVATKVITFLAILAFGALALAPPTFAQQRKAVPIPHPAVTGNIVNDINTDLHGGTTAAPSIAGVSLTGDITKDGPKIWTAILAANSADLNYAAAMAKAADALVAGQ